MKKISYFLILSFLLTTFLSCKKIADTINPAANGSMSFTLNNNSWSAKETSAVRVLGAVSVSGTGSDGSNLLLSLNENSLKTGAKFSVGDAAIVAYETAYTSATDETFIPQKGTIEITSFSSSHIEGNFNLTLSSLTTKSSVTITNGKFSANIIL